MVVKEKYMSVIKIDYDKLEIISSNAKDASAKMRDYINNLTKKVSNKYSGITGGASAKTNSSSYYVDQKIKNLKKKEQYYSVYSTSISTFSEKAQEIDKEVARTINAAKNEFIDKHDYIDVNWWTELKEWFIDLKNSCPLFNAIGNLIEGTIEGMKNLFADIKHWYKCGGGKETLGIVLAVLGAVAAVCLAIAACIPPICGIVAICAAIGAVITAVNAIYNIYSSCKAKEAKDKGDPAWAKIYGDQDTVQQGLRQHNFKNGTLNKLSYFAATTIDTVQLVCDVVAIYDGIKHVQNTYKEIKKYANQSRTRNFGQIFKDYLFNKKNYKGEKMRDLIQKRADIRTLRNYKATKAMSIAQYQKSLTKGQKFAKKLVKFSGKVKAVQNFGKKIGDKLNGNKFSFSKTAENYTKKVLKKYQYPKLVFKIYDIYDNNWNNSFKYDVNGFKQMTQKAG